MADDDELYGLKPQEKITVGIARFAIEDGCQLSGAHVQALVATILRLLKEGVPARPHEIDAAFHKLVIQERDYERVVNERLRGELAALRADAPA